MAITFSRIIDISQPLYHHCPGNPGFPPMEVVQDMWADECGWNAEKLSFHTHIGTHMDSPGHRKNSGRTIDQMPPDTFIGPATAIDLFNKQPDEPILVSDLEPYTADLKPIVLLCTGWGVKRAKTDEYNFHSPWLSVEAAQWLVDHKVRGVGIDHFSIGGANSNNVAPPHDILLDADVYILEELFLPREILTFQNLQVIALPILLQNGSGAPARALAVEC